MSLLNLGIQQVSSSRAAMPEDSDMFLKGSKSMAEVRHRLDLGPPPKGPKGRGAAQRQSRMMTKAVRRTTSSPRARTRRRMVRTARLTSAMPHPVPQKIYSTAAPR